jgi:hypothetical protein
MCDIEMRELSIGAWAGALGHSLRSRPPSWGLLTARQGCKNKHGTSQRGRPVTITSPMLSERCQFKVVRMTGGYEVLGKGLEHPNRTSRLSNAEAEVSEGPDRASAKSPTLLASER